MRADAFITLNVVQPLRRLFPPKGRRVPILMYHSISDRPEAGHPYFWTVTSPRVFAMHMRYLKENGYTVVTISDALDYIDGKRDFASQPVVITFDDGFADFYANAFPVLAGCEFTAMMYLPTSFIGRTARSFRGVECLTWSQVRELHRAGIEFGSHTVSHAKLVTLPSRQVEDEVRRSRETIEQEASFAVTSFAYPFAFPEHRVVFTGMLRNVLTSSGYRNGVCTSLGVATAKGDRFFTKRLPLNDCDGEGLLQAKLDGAYDWLHSIQVTVPELPAEAIAQ